MFYEFHYAILSQQSSMKCHIKFSKEALFPLQRKILYQSDFSVQFLITSPLSILTFLFTLKGHFFQILVNDAYDYPETTTMYHLSTPGESADIKVEPRIFQVDSEVRKVHPSKRR